MIAFDTNVLVRLLVEDDPEQFVAAVAVLERAVDPGERCYLADAVLCETVWVLTSVYGAGRADILGTFTALATDPRYVFDDADVLDEALHAYAEGSADLSDCLIGARARRRGARTTYTFDRKQKNQEGFTHLRRAVVGAVLLGVMSSTPVARAWLSTSSRQVKNLSCAR